MNQDIVTFTGLVEATGVNASTLRRMISNGAIVPVYLFSTRAHYSVKATNQVLEDVQESLTAGTSLASIQEHFAAEALRINSARGLAIAASRAANKAAALAAAVVPASQGRGRVATA